MCCHSRKSCGSQQERTSRGRCVGRTGRASRHLSLRRLVSPMHAWGATDVCNFRPGCVQSPDGITPKSKNESVQPHRFVLVELEGIEPSTPCLQSRCSSQLSYSPSGSHDRSKTSNSAPEFVNCDRDLCWLVFQRRFSATDRAISARNVAEKVLSERAPEGEVVSPGL